MNLRQDPLVGSVFKCVRGGAEGRNLPGAIDLRDTEHCDLMDLLPALEHTLRTHARVLLSIEAEREPAGQTLV
jgi:hypothetical protein